MLGGEDLAELFEQMMGGLMNEMCKAEDPGKTAKQFILASSVTQMDAAASKGNWKKAREMLETNPIFDDDEAKMDCNDLLLTACEMGKINVVKLLLERQDCDINFRCVLYDVATSPLSMACHFGNLDIVRLLLKQKGINVNGFWRDGKKGIPLHEALGVTEGIDKNREYINVDVVKLMLEDSRVDVNERTALGYTAVHMLAARRLPTTNTLMRLVLAHQNLDVNLVTDSELSALSIAIRQGHTENFKVLMNHKDICVNFMGSKQSWTAPMHEAVSFERPEMLKVLIQHQDVDVNVRMSCDDEMDSADATPLYQAAQKDFPDIVRLLLTCPTVEVNAVESHEGFTPLIIASYYGHPEVVELLLNHKGVDVSIQENTFCKTAFNLACLACRTDVVKVFLKSGHTIDVKRAIKDCSNKEHVIQFLCQSEGLDPEETLPKYKGIVKLLDKHLSKKHRQPSRKGLSTKSKVLKKPPKIEQPAQVEEPATPEEQPAIVQIEQPAISKKKVKTAQEKADARVRREARKKEEDIALRELEMSLDTLD